MAIVHSGLDIENEKSLRMLEDRCSLLDVDPKTKMAEQILDRIRNGIGFGVGTVGGIVHEVLGIDVYVYEKSRNDLYGIILRLITRVSKNNGNKLPVWNRDISIKDVVQAGYRENAGGIFFKVDKSINNPEVTQSEYVEKALGACDTNYNYISLDFITSVQLKIANNFMRLLVTSILHKELVGEGDLFIGRTDKIQKWCNGIKRADACIDSSLASMQLARETILNQVEISKIEKLIDISTNDEVLDAITEDMSHVLDIKCSFLNGIELSSRCKEMLNNV